MVSPFDQKTTNYVFSNQETLSNSLKNNKFIQALKNSPEQDTSEEEIDAIVNRLSSVLANTTIKRADLVFEVREEISLTARRQVTTGWAGEGQESQRLGLISTNVLLGLLECGEAKVIDFKKELEALPCFKPFRSRNEAHNFIESLPPAEKFICLIRPSSLGPKSLAITVGIPGTSDCLDYAIAIQEGSFKDQAHGTFTSVEAYLTRLRKSYTILGETK
jgi:hypothetical protein